VTAAPRAAWYDSRFMDTETLSLLQTVCAAGGARAGFNGDSNARLEQLVEDGLLVVAIRLDAHRSFYRPTKKGASMVQTMQLTKAAGFGNS
jgi:hypothetical protein